MCVTSLCSNINVTKKWLFLNIVTSLCQKSKFQPEIANSQNLCGHKKKIKSPSFFSENFTRESAPGKNFLIFAPPY